MENLEEHLRIWLSGGHAFHLKGYVGQRCTGSLLDMDELHLEGSRWGLLGRGSLGECKELINGENGHSPRGVPLGSKRNCPMGRMGVPQLRRRNFDS